MGSDLFRSQLGVVNGNKLEFAAAGQDFRARRTRIGSAPDHGAAAGPTGLKPLNRPVAPPKNK